MKTSKKKPAKKSSKRKSLRGAPIKKKAASKKSVKAASKGKRVAAKVKLAEKGPLKGIQTENLRLVEQLKQKERELEMEAALEKVRSRSLAMHKSDELQEVVNSVFDRFKELEIETDTASIYIVKEGTKDLDCWLQTAEQTYSSGILFPYFDQSIMSRETLIRGEGYVSKTYTKNEKNEWFNLMFLHSDMRKIPEARKQFILDAEAFTGSRAHMKNTSISIFRYSEKAFTVSEHDVLRRFAKVFEQAYIRFLDLQKAEAQARESQIQLALERVRARTMAMQKSDELPEAANLLFQQVQTLGMPAWSAGYCIWDEDKQAITLWMSSEGVLQSPFRAPLTEDPSFIHFREAYEQGETFFVDEIGGEDLVRHYKYMRTLPVVGEILDSIIESGHPLPTFQIFHLAYFSKGFLLFITYEPVPEAHDIFKRFGKVFEQTYTRFLDLQKAEAQAREAQIEVALEKVRSRTLAMHTAHELGEVVLVIVEKLKELGVVLDANGVILCTYFQNSKNVLHWIASPDFSFAGSYLLPYFDHPIFKDAWESKMSGADYFSKSFTVEEKNSFFEYAFEHSDYKYFPDEFKQWVFQNDKHSLSFAWQKNSAILIPSHTGIVPGEGDKEILKRFSKVFEQAYIRFLDLQKAEAQAREAQIEAALERVRSRAMAMQTSEELNALIGTVFTELTKLDLVLTRCVIMTYDHKTNDARWWMANSEAPEQPMNFHVQYHEHPPNLAYFSAWREQRVKWIYTLEGKVKKEWDDLLFSETELRLLPDFVIAGMKAPERVYLNVSFYNSGNLTLASLEPLSDEHFDILIRFAKVFDLTYTRFNDLKQAEAQAREAKIEAALERVRSRTMAMQRSDELVDVASILFQQVKALGVPQWNCGFNIWEIGDKEFTYYPGSPDGIISPSPCKIPLTEHPVFMSFDESRKRGDELFVYEKEGEYQAGHYRYMLSLPGVGDLLQSMLDAGFKLPTFQIDHIVNFSRGNLIFITYEHFPEMHDIFKRFGRVFEQTYTRFLDLQKAEAQAREAQIEATLEKVRSRSLAMHKSDEVGFVVDELFLRMKDLEIGFDSVNILEFTEDAFQVWAAYQPGKFAVTKIPLSKSDITYVRNVIDAKNSGLKLFTHQYTIEEKNEFLNYLFDQTHFKNLPEERKQFLLQCPCYTVSIGFAKNTAIQLQSYSRAAFSESENNILKRCVNVFEQAYTRFLDLQKAEAQAREAQIEAALERVRSRTMAMHRSEEIADIVGKIFKELTSLDVALNRVLIWIVNPDEKYFTWWSANPETESNAESYRVNYVDHPVFLAYYEAWQKKLPLLLYPLGDDLKVSWEDYLFKNTELSRLPKPVQDGMRSEKKIFTTSAISDYGLLMAGCFEPFSNEINDIIQRFGRVFQQSYTRYLDVQKAEAQAREATIEASLEKVRGKAMSMHNSNDLTATASLVFTELRKLGIDSFRSGVGLLTRENRNVKLFSATSSEEGGSFSVVGWAVLDHHPVLSRTYDSWINNEDYFPVLKGETLKSYYDNIIATFTVPVEQSEGYEQHGYFLPFSEGLFYGWSEKPYTEQEIKILNRFRGIVDLTFRRYMELEKSEAIAKEAIRQASLDRVRAEIASMRTTNDLDRITPLIWKELNILSIPFVRCGVFIMDDNQQLMHTFLSTPEGEAIAAFHLPYDTPGNTGEILSHWKNKQMYISHWDESAFSDLGEQLVKQGAIPSKDVYMSTIPPDGIHLHCLPFLQGMLYVGNTTQLKEDDIHLIQSVADAFSTAYARYEDFNKLESAKIQIEKTLTDLKQTQNLLVQSEKMASLGELTAGIAHEIQNPLNFVNNFSEVSNELLEEMKEEIEKGNYDEVQAITSNIKQNLEKILHHGKRADGIVKGMLQHSRSSSGVKEPTDINALADEYLRLAYHGFRAKDKSFNASTNTDLDKSIGKINVVPQDIGRVVLNLITNAFFAVTEKQKHTAAEYQPTVFLSTKRRDDCVLISVKDNGNGIPKQIREKIFQPFFTTKPTGQGTGLGLSLSYDIVKAHGGELTMETAEGEGSEFVISIMDK